MTNVLKWMAPLALVIALVGFMSTSKADDKAPATGKGSISGVVNGTDGKPAANVSIWVRPPKEKADKPKKNQKSTDVLSLAKKPADLEGEATTDADGKFTVKDIVVGKHVVTARTEDGKLFARETVTVEDGKDVSTTLTLKEAPAKKN